MGVELYAENMRGVFITFEGGEGAGKGTQIALLNEALENRGLEVMLTREPGGTPLGEKVRHLLKFDPETRDMTSRAELLLFLAARAQLVEKKILPALEAGKVVISDRFIDSSVVYQGIGRALGVETVEGLNDFATASHKPDLTIVLDISVEKGFERVGKRAPEKTGATDRIESSPRAFFEAVRRGYLELASREPERVKVVDADRDVKEVHSEVMKHVEYLLGR